MASVVDINERRSERDQYIRGPGPHHHDDDGPPVDLDRAKNWIDRIRNDLRAQGIPRRPRRNTHTEAARDLVLVEGRQRLRARAREET